MKRNIKILLIVLATLGTIATVYYVYFREKTSENNHKNDMVETQEDVPETALENFTEGTDREPGNSVGEDEGSGTISQSNDLPDDFKITSESSDGNIKVSLPIKNTLLKSGDDLLGISEYDKVYFRLIDSISGVVAEGSVNTKSGKFSGIFNFTTRAQEGRLDIFYRDDNGLEKSNLEIPVRFTE